MQFLSGVDIAPGENRSLPRDRKAMYLQQCRRERGGDDPHGIAQRELQ
jgi:hypothetical protein